MHGNSLLSGGPEIVFSSSTLAGYFLCGTVYLLLPLIAFLGLKKYHAARKYPVITGMIAYFLAVRFSEILAHMIGFSQSYAAQAVIAAELVCTAEEAARWLAMRYPVTDIRKTNAALCYGIGHGGLECWTRGIQKLQIFRSGLQLNNEGIGSFIAEQNAEQTAVIARNLQDLADHPLFLSMFDVLNSITTFSVQIALSLLIFRKMTETNYQMRWLFLAVILHFFLNGSVWLASFSGAPYLISAVGIMSDVIVILVIFRIIDGWKCLDALRYPPDDLL